MPGAIVACAMSVEASLSPSSTSVTGIEEDIDDRSKKGQFGWFTIGNAHVPYIFRNKDEEFCSVRMAEHAALNNYLKFLNKDIFNCINVKSFWVTAAEAELLNQINFVHCNGQFGRDMFNRDVIVKVSDVHEFYNFLQNCYSKLLGNSKEESRFGFIIINQESVVPYTVVKGRKFVPLFYFEGEIDQLIVKSCHLDGWDLSYLKFCCKIQGIKNQLFAQNTCSVIDLEDVKLYFPPDTTFDEYWPTKTVDMQMLVTTKTQTALGGWTKPATPQPQLALPIIPNIIKTSNRVSTKRR